MKLRDGAGGLGNVGKGGVGGLAEVGLGGGSLLLLPLMQNPFIELK